MFRVEISTCPGKRDRLRICTARTFVPLTIITISVQNLPMSQETLTRAWEVLQDAYQAQMEGDYDRAVELYQSSLELHPTAEAHTFLGWTYHYQGKRFPGCSRRSKRGATSLAIFRITTWDAHIWARRCMVRPCAAFRKPSRSSRVTRWPARRSNRCDGW